MVKVKENKRKIRERNLSIHILANTKKHFLFYLTCIKKRGLGVVYWLSFSDSSAAKLLKLLQ